MKRVVFAALALTGLLIVASLVLEVVLTTEFEHEFELTVGD